MAQQSNTPTPSATSTTPAPPPSSTNPSSTGAGQNHSGHSPGRGGGGGVGLGQPVQRTPSGSSSHSTGHSHHSKVNVKKEAVDSQEAGGHPPLVSSPPVSAGSNGGSSLFNLSEPPVRPDKQQQMLGSGGQDGMTPGIVTNPFICHLRFSCYSHMRIVSLIAQPFFGK